MGGTKCLCSIAIALLLGGDLARAGALVVSSEKLADGQSVATPAIWNTFVVDVKVRHRRIDASGQKTDAAPEGTTYTLERRRDGDRWKTTYIIGPRDPQPVETPQGTTDLKRFLPIARIETDASGRRRFYDSGGREMALPSRNDIQKLLRHSVSGPPLQPTPAAVGAGAQPDTQGTGWLDGLLNSADKRDERRGRLVQQYGKPSKYKALDRYLRVDGQRVRELLVEPATAVPVEINVMSGGVLQSHTTLQYSSAPDGSRVKRGLHVEAIRQGAPEERDVTDVAFENPRFEQRGGAQ
jgi:hypothetical protein